MRLKPIMEYVREKGDRRLIRAVKWFRVLIPKSKNIYIVTEKQVDAESRRDLNLAGVVGLTFPLYDKYIIFVDEGAHRKHNVSILETIIHELAHATEVDMLLLGEKEKWANTVMNYLMRVFEIEEKTGVEVERNPLTILKMGFDYTITRILEYIEENIENRKLKLKLLKTLRETIRKIKSTPACEIIEELEIVELANKILTTLCKHGEYHHAYQLLKHTLK